MNGVMIPEVSAGSNQVGASEICAPQVNCPCGAAMAHSGMPAARPNAPSASKSRRLMPWGVEAGSICAGGREFDFIGASGPGGLLVAALYASLEHPPPECLRVSQPVLGTVGRVKPAHDQRA